MLLEEPYFLKSKEWYYYDMDTGQYKLTDKALQKAIDSYNEYYKKLEENIDLDTNKKEIV